MADLDDAADTLLDTTTDSIIGREEADDSVLSEINHDSLVEGAEDPELEAIKARVKEMEEEAEKLKEMQKQVEQSIMSPTASGGPPKTIEEKVEVDGRSVYVGNVDYSATAEELEQHFHGCGSVNRVTILCDKFSGHPKGFAYVEFTEKESVDNAVSLHESLFKGRQIKVSAKRTNRPGISTTNRGRGRGRGGMRGGFFNPYNPYMGGGFPRGRGRAMFRGRGRSNWYTPY